MRTLIIGLIGEIRKNLLINWNYKANVFVSLFTLGFIFVGIVFFIGRRGAVARQSFFGVTRLPDLDVRGDR